MKKVILLSLFIGLVSMVSYSQSAASVNFNNERLFANKVNVSSWNAATKSWTLTKTETYTQSIDFRNRDIIFNDGVANRYALHVTNKGTKDGSVVLDAVADDGDKCTVQLVEIANGWKLQIDWSTNLVEYYIDSN